MDWWVLSLGNPPSREEAICCRENLSPDMRVLDLAGLEAPSVCAYNPRRPEITVLSVRNILGSFAECKGEGRLPELHHFRRNLSKLETNLKQVNSKLKIVNTKFGVPLF